MDGHEMRLLVTGVDGDGRGCVVGEEWLGMELSPGRRVWHATAYTAPTVLAPQPKGSSDFMDLQIASGRVRWLVIDYEADAEQEMHHTDTVDLDIVLQGSIELVLDDGPHLLRAGDGAIVNGVDHAWRSGAEGCRLSVTFIGTPPRS
jgi:mannose-6-phosphate isomerase-like protein (cupin superfamily)